MADADSVLGSISLDEIIELGNAWIRLGDDLHERRVAVKGKVDGIDMTGKAGDAMRLAWDDGLSKTIDDAAETAWTVGQTIHRYADELKKAADEYAKKVNASMWAMILGSILGMAFMALGPLLSGLLSAIGALLARLIPVLTQIAARIGTVGTTAIGAIGGAVSGAALNLGIDVAAGAAGAAIAGTDYDVDWGAEAWSLGLGGLVGGLGGGFAGYHYTPHPAGPVGGPKGTPPPTAPPKATPDTGGVPGGIGDGPGVSPPPRVPGGGAGGDHTFSGPGSFRGDGGPGALNPPQGGGASAHASHPTSSGPGGGRTGDIGMPNTRTGGDGSQSAPPPGNPATAPGKPLAQDTPVPSQSRPTPGGGRPGSGDVPTPAPPVQHRPGGAGGQGGRPGSGDVPTPTPPVQERPGASGNGGRSDAFGGPGQRLGGPQENPHGTPKPAGNEGGPGGGPSRQPGGRTDDPFTGPGQRLGGPQENPHGTPAPKTGDDGPGQNTSSKPGTNSGSMNDPFTGPGQKLGGPQSNPHGTPEPQRPGPAENGPKPGTNSGGNDPFTGPGQKLGGPQSNPHGTPEPQRPGPAENGPQSHQPGGNDPFTGPGQKLGGPQANPHGTPEPQPGTAPPGSHQPAPTPPAGRGHDFPATADNRPPGATGEGTSQGGKPPVDPFAGPGQKLGGPQSDPHGTTQPRPEGGPRTGEGSVGGKPPARTGTGYDRPATLDDTPGGGGRGSGSGSGGGNVRANEGSNTYIETAPTGSRPEPAPGGGEGRGGGSGTRPGGGAEGRTDGPTPGGGNSGRTDAPTTGGGTGGRPDSPAPGGGNSGLTGGPAPGHGQTPHDPAPGTNSGAAAGGPTTGPGQGQRPLDPSPGSSAPSGGPLPGSGARPGGGTSGTTHAPGTDAPKQSGPSGTTHPEPPGSKPGRPTAPAESAPSTSSGPANSAPSRGGVGAGAPATGGGREGDPAPTGPDRQQGDTRPATGESTVGTTPPTVPPNPESPTQAPTGPGSGPAATGGGDGHAAPAENTPDTGTAPGSGSDAGGQPGPGATSSGPVTTNPGSTTQVPAPDAGVSGDLGPNPASSAPGASTPEPTPRPTDETPAPTPVVPTPSAPAPANTLPAPGTGSPGATVPNPGTTGGNASTGPAGSSGTATSTTGPNSTTSGPVAEQVRPNSAPAAQSSAAPDPVRQSGPGTAAPVAPTSSSPGPLPGNPPLGQQTPGSSGDTKLPTTASPSAQEPHTGTGRGADTSAGPGTGSGPKTPPAQTGGTATPPPQQNGASSHPTSSGPAAPAPGEGAGSGPQPSTTPLDSFAAQVLAHEIRRELGRLNWTGPSITPDDAVRLHDALPTWRQNQPLRARGEAIAQTLVGGAPFRLPGGSPTEVYSDTEMMDVDDVPASPPPAQEPAHEPEQAPRPPHEQLTDIAQSVMDDVRHRIRYGQANQVSSVAASGGGTREMLALAREGVHRQPVATAQERLGQDAVVAEIIGTGNCGEHAAMSFALLNRTPLPPGTSLWFVDLNLRQGEDPEHPIAPYTDHVFVAVGDENDPENIVVVDPWQIGAVPVPARHFNFPFLLPGDGRWEITPRAERAVPDGRDYLHEARGTVDVGALENQMDLTGPSVDPSSFAGQPGMYEHRQQYGGLRGGSADQGVDPVAAHWPVGRPVTLAGPRAGGVTRVPVAPSYAPAAGGSSAPYTPFTLPVPEGAGASSSRQPGYEVNPAGWVRLPDGTELSPHGWTSFGDDFLHTPSGALLRGDSGWIGTTANFDTVVPAWDHLDPDAAPHTLTVHPGGIRVVPARVGGPAASAVDIPLVRGDIAGDITGDIADGIASAAPETATPASASSQLPTPAGPFRHPGAARFDLEAARQRLTDPATPPAWREEALTRAEDMVFERIAAVAPGENPAGVVPRPDEVVQLVAAEFLRGMHLPARALARELIGGSGLFTPEAPAAREPGDPVHAASPAAAPAALDSLGAQILAHEVRRELSRLQWTGAPVTPAELERLHEALPSWQLRRPLRARGEAIAQTLVSGAPAALPGGSRTTTWSDTDMMDVDDFPAAPARGTYGGPSRHSGPSAYSGGSPYSTTSAYSGAHYSDQFYDPRTAPPTSYRSPALREMERRSRQYRPVEQTRSVGSRRTPAAVVPRESRPSRHSHQPRSGRVQVVPRPPQEQLRELGRTVLDDVRSRIRYGQANQISSVAAHGGGTREMLAYSRDDVHRQPVSSHQEWLGQSAAIAEIVGTGNCGEHAAMTFALLNRAPLPPGTSIWYVDLNLQPGEDRRNPIAPHTDHVFVAVGRRSRPEEIIVIDPWQIDAQPVTARNFNFPFLVTVDGRPRVTPRAIRFEPDGRDYLRLGRATIDVAELENHMDLTGPSVDPTTFAGQPGMYEHRQQYGGLRGGSADQGVDPVASRWPVGRPVTLAGPRTGGVTRVPFSPARQPGAGGSSAPYTSFTLPVPDGAGASSSARPGYAVNPGGWIRLPDGTELSPLGWTSFGDDFLHTPTGAYLRGDSGWIGHTANLDTVTAAWDHLDPHAEPHTLVPHGTGIHLVPTRPGAPATAITLVPSPATATTEGMDGASAQAPVGDQLEDLGLSPIHVPTDGDALAHALIAAAPAESGALAGHSWPAGPEELRSGLGAALAADVRLPREEARLWPALTEATTPDGAPLLASAAPDAVRDALADVRGTTGGRDADWLTLALAAPVLGLRLTVLTDTGSAWSAGPEDGRAVVLARFDAPAPFTGPWAATEPTEQADAAHRPDTSGSEASSGPTWGTPQPVTSATSTPTPPVSSTPATRPLPSPPPRTETAPQTFFGLDPRPVTREPVSREAEPVPVPPRDEPSEAPPQQRTEPVGTYDTTGPQPTDDAQPTGTAATSEPAETTPAEPSAPLSPYVLTYGSRLDGSVGLVAYEPIADTVLDALHQHILDSLGVTPGGAEESAAREQLGELLDAAEIVQHLPSVRSARGHRVVVVLGDVEHPVDVRLRLTDPRASARSGAHAEVPRSTKVERQNEGGQSSSAGESSGTNRTVPIPWTGVYDGPAGALRWFDGSLTLSLTHNQLSLSATVNDGVTTTTMQRANDAARPVEFTGAWQTRVDADRRDADPATWGAERRLGPLTVWFPEHRAQVHETATGPHPEPAALDDLPLWGVDGLGEPGRLLDEVLGDDAFAALHGLGEDSRRELEGFLSDRVLRGTLPMQRGRGVYSPVLTDGNGSAVGVLRLTATVRPGATRARTPEGQFALESWLTHTSGVDRSARLTSGLGLEGSGGPQFTGDHAAGHPSAATRVGGGVYGKGGAAWQSTDALNTASKASLMHGLLTTGSHLLVSADIVYRLTLVRAGGGEVTGSFGPWPDSAELRLPPRSLARGQAPTGEELRRLPGHLEHLQGIGFSAVPLSAHGTEVLFDRAEDWLRGEGFLPPREHALYALDEPRVHAQLANLRRLEQLRSAHGLATALPDAVEGGRPVWFELPGRIGGSRRVQLRFTAVRDRTPLPGTTGAPPAVHTRRLPEVESTGSSSYEARGTRQRGTQFGGSVGFGGGPRWPLAGGGWSLDSVADYTWGRQHGAASTAGSALGTDQVIVTSGDGTEVFAVPARFALDLFEGVAEEPSVRFAAPPAAPRQEEAARPAPIGLLGRPVEPAAPVDVAGHVTLAVPHRRTAPATDVLPAPAPRPVIRAPRTGGGVDDDARRLALTDGEGRPLPGLTRLPDDASVDLFRVGEALQDALRQLVRGAGAGLHPAGPLGRSLHTFTGRLPSVVTTPGARVAEYLAGPSAASRGAFAGEALFQQTRVSSVLARAQQILNGGYVVEGLVLPGLGADQEFQLEITCYLHRPRGDGGVRASVESDLSAKDASARQSSSITTQQGGGGVTALRALPATPRGGRPPRVAQANPSGRVTGARVDERTGERSAGTSVVRVPTESGELHVVTADATLLVTLRQGTRNLLGNLVGLGARAGVTVAVDVPDAIRFSLSTEQLARNARWFVGAPGLPRPVLAAPTLPLPDRFVRTGELGTGAVLTVTQLDDPVRRQESRDRLRRELLALVEREAPGATRPGHSAYLPGVATRIADLTSPAALRALPGRRSMSLWFRHATARGTRLVEVTVRARTEASAPVLRQVRGRAAGEGTGLDHTTVHTPAGRADTHGLTSTFQASATPLSRFPRPGEATGRSDRTGPVLSLSATRGRTVRTDATADDRFKTRTDRVADFDGVGYVLTGSVRSSLVLDWPPDLLGGVLDEGWLALTERDGGGFAQRLGRMLRGRPAREVRVPAAATLRFAGSEAVEPRPHTPPVPPRVTHVDPRLPASEGPLPLGDVPFAAGPPLVPTGPTPVAGFNGLRQLSEALEAVAPATTAAWGLTADAAPEAAAARLGELVQAGRITIDPAGTASGLSSTMPGAWPVGERDEEPALQVTLHNPRPVSDAEDMAVDRLRLPSRTVTSGSAAGHTVGLGHQFTQSGTDRNMHLLGLTVPVLQRQPVSGTAGAAASGSQRDRVKIGAPARAETGTNTRSYETLVDAVIAVTGPEGTRYVTGSATVRLFERDLLGHGVVGPRTASRVYDLPSMLARQPDAALRDWARHPVGDLPGVLAAGLDGDESAAQLWLDLGPDPDAARLARALYVGSRTAVAAGRPVELALRGATGLRFWPFTAEGRLADLTPGTAATGERLHAAIVTATDAMAAEADAAARATDLRPREDQAARELALAQAELSRATAEHDAAATALTQARAAHEALGERLAQAESAREDAEREAALRAAEATVAADSLAAAEQAAAIAGPEDGSAQQVLWEARLADGIARSVATAARESADRAAATVEDLGTRLTAAGTALTSAAHTRSTAATALARATAARDRLHRAHEDLRADLRAALQDQADQAAIQDHAWTSLPGLSGRLSADRCYEGTGGARYPLDSLAPGAGR